MKTKLILILFCFTAIASLNASLTEKLAHVREKIMELKNSLHSESPLEANCTIIDCTCPCSTKNCGGIA